jgi:threonine dehydrogenase-like Zn-dependent dehydrogenase
LRTGGVGVIMGGNLAMPTVSSQEYMVRCLRIIGTRNHGRRASSEILKLLANGRMAIDDLITHTFALSQINDALGAIEKRTEKTWMVGINVADDGLSSSH